MSANEWHVGQEVAVMGGYPGPRVTKIAKINSRWVTTEDGSKWRLADGWEAKPGVWSSRRIVPATDAHREAEWCSSAERRLDSMCWKDVPTATLRAVIAALDAAEKETP